MRFFVWVCRLILLVVVGAFVATVFYMTHDVGTDMDSAKPVLNLVTVIGAGVLGLAWPLMRRYWQAFLLLVGMGVLRGLFATDPGLSSLEAPLLTPFQADYIWFAIGVTGFFLLATLVARAVMSDRKLRALRQVPKIETAAPVSAAASAPAAAPAAKAKDKTAEAATVAAELVPEAAESVGAQAAQTEPADKK